MAPLESAFKSEEVRRKSVVEPMFETAKRFAFAPLFEVDPTAKSVESTEEEAAWTERVA